MQDSLQDLLQDDLLTSFSGFSILHHPLLIPVGVMGEPVNPQFPSQSILDEYDEELTDQNGKIFPSLIPESVGIFEKSAQDLQIDHGTFDVAPVDLEPMNSLDNWGMSSIQAQNVSGSSCSSETSSLPQSENLEMLISGATESFIELAEHSIAACEQFIQQAFDSIRESFRGFKYTLQEVH